MGNEGVNGPGVEEWRDVGGSKYQYPGAMLTKQHSASMPSSRGLMTARSVKCLLFWCGIGNDEFE